MSVPSIKKNYFLNVFRVVFGTLVGIFTMPYVNKTLGVAGLGKVEYVNSIIAYFVMLSALGIPMYGIREVAKVKNDREKRTKLVVELLFILSLTTILSYIVIFGVIIHLDFFSTYRETIVLMSSMVLFTNIGAEWFYQGMEDQMFITVRYTIMRIIALILLFVLVRSPEDYLYYAFVLVFSVVGGNIFNFLYLRKYLDFSVLKWENLDIKKHLKPILTIFIASISVSIYIQLDNLMLGSIVGDVYVGYYVVANKLIRFAVLFITTLGAVLLPRMSRLIKEDKEQYIAYAQKSVNYIVIIAVPCMMLFYLFAEDFIMLMAGEDYIPSIATMKILSPIILIVGLAYFVGYLVLYPQGKEKIYTITTVFTAVFSVALNSYVIPRFHHNGVAFVAFLSELLGVVLMCYLGRKELKDIKIFNKSLYICLLTSVGVCLVVFYLKTFFEIENLIIRMCVEMFLSVSLFFGVLLMLREHTVMQITKLVLKKYN